MSGDTALRNIFSGCKGEFEVWSMERGEGNEELDIDCKIVCGTLEDALAAAIKSGSGRIDIYEGENDYAMLREVTRDGEAYSADNKKVILVLDSYSALNSACFIAAEKLAARINFRKALSDGVLTLDDMQDAWIERQEYEALKLLVFSGTLGDAQWETEERYWKKRRIDKLITYGYIEA